MAKFKLGSGQGLQFGQYLVFAIVSGCRMVPLRVPGQIQVIRGYPGEASRRYRLEPRQSLCFPDGGRLLSDSRHTIELAVHGPAGELLDTEPMARGPQTKHHAMGSALPQAADLGAGCPRRPTVFS